MNLNFFPVYGKRPWASDNLRKSALRKATALNRRRQHIRTPSNEGMIEEHPFDKYVGNGRLSPVETRETPPKRTHIRLNSGSLEFLDPFADEGPPSPPGEEEPSTMTSEQLFDELEHFGFGADAAVEVLAMMDPTGTGVIPLSRISAWMQENSDCKLEEEEGMHEADFDFDGDAVHWRRHSGDVEHPHHELMMSPVQRLPRKQNRMSDTKLKMAQLQLERQEQQLTDTIDKYEHQIRLLRKESFREKDELVVEKKRLQEQLLEKSIKLSASEAKAARVASENRTLTGENSVIKQSLMDAEALSVRHSALQKEVRHLNVSLNNVTDQNENIKRQHMQDREMWRQHTQLLEADLARQRAERERSLTASPKQTYDNPGRQRHNSTNQDLLSELSELDDKTDDDKSDDDSSDEVYEVDNEFLLYSPELKLRKTVSSPEIPAPSLEEREIPAPSLEEREQRNEPDGEATRQDINPNTNTNIDDTCEPRERIPTALLAESYPKRQKQRKTKQKITSEGKLKLQRWWINRSRAQRHRRVNSLESTRRLHRGHRRTRSSPLRSQEDNNAGPTQSLGAMRALMQQRNSPPLKATAVAERQLEQRTVDRTAPEIRNIVPEHASSSAKILQRQKSRAPVFEEDVLTSFQMPVTPIRPILIQPPNPAHTNTANGPASKPKKHPKRPLKQAPVLNPTLDPHNPTPLPHTFPALVATPASPPRIVKKIAAAQKNITPKQRVVSHGARPQVYRQPNEPMHCEHQPYQKIVPTIPFLDEVDTLHEIEKIKSNTGAPAPVAEFLAEALQKDSANAKPEARARCCANNECVIS